MMYLRWALLAPISLLANIFAWITSPFWAAWAATRAQHSLPVPFNYIHTLDNSVFGFDFTGKDVPATWGERFANAFWWIRRNPCYGFDSVVLGFPDAGARILQREYTPGFDTGKSASHWILFELPDGGRRFSWRRDVPLGGKRYIKIWAGWNANNLAGWHPLKIMFNPFRKAD